MSRFASEHGRIHWIALVAIAVLIAGIAIAWRQSRVPRMPERAVTTEPEAPPEAVEQALSQTTPIDSTAYKQRWLDEVRGLDLGDLTPARRELFLRYANAEQCTCGCGYTLAGCRASDMTCDISGPRLAALLDSVRAGRVHDARGIRARPQPRG